MTPPKQSITQPSSRFALITPARNEDRYIGALLDSVVNQTRLPVSWVIVDDNSTDRTGELVESYAAKYDFIERLNAPLGATRNYASKATAFMAGYARLAGLDYDFIGNLDADVYLPPDYFERVLDAMLQNPRVGVAGGIILEKIHGHYIAQNTSLNSVAGAVQLFRRDCFEKIGGILALEMGGEDSAAEIMARMHGWAVRTVPELEVRTSRPVTMNSHNVLMARINKGIVNYSLGYHPLFQIVAGVYRMLERPYILGGALMIGGYFWGGIKRMKRQVPKSMIEYLRDEQMKRLRSGFKVRRLLLRHP